MSKLNHTPGPWKISRGAQADPFSIEAEDCTVAYCRWAWSEHDPGPRDTARKAEANAKLIAAAPEMYELLRRAECAVDITDEAQELIAELEAQDS